MGNVSAKGKESGLTEFQKRKLEYDFHTFLDLNNDGYLTYHDFLWAKDKICCMSGWKVGSAKHRITEALFVEIWKSLEGIADLDKDGKISTTEWLEMWTVYKKEIMGKEKGQKDFLKEFYHRNKELERDGQQELELSGSVSERSTIRAESEAASARSRREALRLSGLNSTSTTVLLDSDEEGSNNNQAVKSVAAQEDASSGGKAKKKKKKQRKLFKKKKDKGGEDENDAERGDDRGRPANESCADAFTSGATEPWVEYDSLTTLELFTADKPNYKDTILPKWLYKYLVFRFNLLDRTGDNLIDHEEFEYVLSEFGVSEKESRQAFTIFTKNDTCVLDFEYFVTLFEEYYLSDDPSALGNFINGKLEFDIADNDPGLLDHRSVSSTSVHSMDDDLNPGTGKANKKKTNKKKEFEGGDSTIKLHEAGKKGGGIFQKMREKCCILN